MKFAVSAAFVLLVLACNSSALVDNKTCLDNANPLNLPKYGLQNERINRGGWGGGDYKKPEDMHHMVFKWIPRDSVTCPENQLPPDVQLKKFKFVEDEVKRTIDVDLSCQSYIYKWMKKMKDIVLQDLLVTIKDKSNELFNKYYDLKITRFGPTQLISDMGEEVIEALEKLGQDLQDGFILPNQAQQPSYGEFYEALGDSIVIYRHIQKLAGQPRVYTQKCKYEAILNREKSRNECLLAVLGYATGEKWDSNQSIYVGYGDINIYLEKAIRVMRNHFKAEPKEYKISVPNRKPCFSN